jgi:3-deoxy-D-manno-octulosonic acid (KDO) 8-phosphate synthase
MEVADKVYSICKNLDSIYIQSLLQKSKSYKWSSFTGLGDDLALGMINHVKKKILLPATTDIHAKEEAVLAAQHVDILQIPAFLCRQTDLLEAAAKTGKIVNVKKGQFVSGKP